MGDLLIKMEIFRGLQFHVMYLLCNIEHTNKKKEKKNYFPNVVIVISIIRERFNPFSIKKKKKMFIVCW